MSIRWLGLVLLLWALPQRDARADLSQMLRAGWPCQPMTMLMLTQIGGAGVFPLGRTAVAGDPNATQAAVEVGTAVQCSPRHDDGAALMFFPELGYSWTDSGGGMVPESSTHLGKLGVGIGFGNSWATVSYVPRLVAGARDGEFAFGLRHGLVGRFVYNLLAVEVSHQVLGVAGVPEHDLRVGATMNLFLFVAALAYMR